MAVSKPPSITPETSSGEGLDEEPVCRGEAKWKRFHPFRVVRKIFRRRVKRQGTGEGADTSKKSWSTSELQSVQDTSEKYEVPSPPYKIGLSVSHDGIFSPESSNLVISEELNRPQGSSLSVQHVGMKSMFQDELFSRVRARRDSEDDDEDVGLPHSPCTSPTTVDVLGQGLKAKPLKSGSLSAGSLASVGSSENDEDSAVASSSGNSSRMSLLDRRSLDFEYDPDFHQPIPLNHNAAHHKISVRPKRTHGLPQKRLKQLTASRLATLPTTLEVTEDVGKSNLKFESHEVVSTASVVQEEIMTKVASTCDDNIISQSVIESVTETVTSERMSKSLLVETCQNITTSQFLQTASEVGHITSSTSYESENLNSGNVQKDVTKHPNDNINDVPNAQFDESSVYTKKESQESVQYMESSSSVSKMISAISLSKSDLDDALIKTEEHDDNVLLKQSSLRVSALIKNIERSDSFSKQGKDKGLNVLSKPFGAKDEAVSPGADLKVDLFCKSDSEQAQALEDAKILEDSSPVMHKNLTEISTVAAEAANASVAKPCTDKHVVSPEAKQEKASEEKSDLKFPAESKLHMEIRHQFQQQKAVKTQEQVSSTSRMYSEEESIMSEKNFENSYNTEDSCITVSHQIPGTVEAHNLVTVDKSFTANLSNICTRATGEMKADSHKLVGSHDSLSESSDNISNIIVHSLASSTCSQMASEEKVTISVNSQLGESRTESFDTPRKAKEPVQRQPQSTEEKSLAPQPHSSGKQRVCDKPPVTEKVVSRSKDIDLSKRLSVEIVPFSQRIKDRKYQPLIYSNKGVASDTRINASGAVVERNLSDRRINAKNKDPEKASNRHSFSGSLSVDLEKPSFSSEKKTPVKVDKLHYPVQIRIHKNKTYEKENHFDKTRTDTKKSQSPDPSGDGKRSQISKTASEGIHAKSVPAKWEVKVHSTSQVKKGETFSQEQREVESKEESIKTGSASHHSHQIREPKSCSPQPLVIPKHIHEKTSPTSSLIESALLKNRENIRKSNRDTQSSEDPEPELLRVFARRSIKQKPCDKEKLDDHPIDTVVKPIPPTSLYQDKGPDGDLQSSNSADTPVSKNYDVLMSKNYDVPMSKNYDIPMSKNYDATMSKNYDAPVSKNYDAPVSKNYDAPVSKNYDAPVSKNYDAPMSKNYDAPVSKNYDTPVSKNYDTPVSKNSDAPVSKNYDAQVSKNYDAPELFKSSLKSPDLVKKKSKSFCEKEKPGPHIVTPLKEVGLNRRPSLILPSPETSSIETFHQRQRLVSEPNITPVLPPLTDNAVSHQQTTVGIENASHTCLHRSTPLSTSPSSTLSNGSSIDVMKGKDNSDVLNRDGSAPSWLQLAQQRRELREQRERLLIGSSANSFLDASSKPSRSSKVWDMVNNFQKMQMT